jgi:hypothetical protein
METRTEKKLRRRKVPEPIESQEPTAPEKEPVHCQPASLCDDSQVRIAKRAYDLYLERGSCAGSAFEDWLDAEREILGRECDA